MSVLIKGIELPEACAECPCLRHDNINGVHGYQCNVTLKSFNANNAKMWNSRADDCPMMEAEK